MAFMSYQISKRCSKCEEWRPKKFFRCPECSTILRTKPRTKRNN